MTAEVLEFRPAPQPVAAEFFKAVSELHALISIDPVMGASPARVYFVLNPEAKVRIAGLIDGAQAARAPLPTAYAVMTYDFPFALHLIEIAGRPNCSERAKTIATLSAGLQAANFEAAADALGLAALLVTGFDAKALKTTFFPNTQETAIHLFRLEFCR